MNRSVAVLAAAVATVIGTAPVTADGADVSPTVVEELDALVDGDAVHVSGTVTWGDQAPVVVGASTGGAPPGGPAGTALGLDLVEIAVHQPDGNVDELQFVWRLSELNLPPPHEVAYYLWEFQVDDERYELWGKTSDLTNVWVFPYNLDPEVDGAFRLRGDCGDHQVVGPVNLNACTHLAWVDGEFDLDADEVRMRVPIGSTVARHFAAGAGIHPYGNGGGAGLGVVFRQPDLRKIVPQTDTYTIPEKTVEVRLVDVEGTVVAAATAPVDAGGGFSASIATGGLAGGSYDVAVEACFADSCSARNAEVQLLEGG